MLTSYLPIGHRPSDNERERKLKSIFALVMIGCALLALDYMLLRPRSSLEFGLDLFLLAALLSALAILQVTKQLDQAFLLFACLVIPGEAGLVLLSGNREGDLLVFVLIPVWAIALLGPRRSIPWFVICVVAVVAVAVADPFLPRLASSLHETPGNPNGWLFHGPDKEPIGSGKASSYFAATVLIYLMMYTAYRAIHNANARIEALLLNILPPSIAARLSERDERNIPETGAAIADEFDQATILFADIVGFSGLAARTSAAELLTILDRVFAAFDALATKHEVEKIKTIGDAYMAVCGLPDPNSEHAGNIAELALDMIESSERLGAEQGIPISLRIGINTGPVIAGVIGRKKFIYDLWGEAVNTASRMESHGEPNTIRVGKGTYEALKERYEFEPLGEMAAKGMGHVPAWRLLGRRAGFGPTAGRPDDKSPANG